MVLTMETWVLFLHVFYISKWAFFSYSPCWTLLQQQSCWERVSNFHFPVTFTFAISWEQLQQDISKGMSLSFFLFYLLEKFILRLEWKNWQCSAKGLTIHFISHGRQAPPFTLISNIFSFFCLLSRLTAIYDKGWVLKRPRDRFWDMQSHSMECLSTARNLGLLLKESEKVKEDGE